MLCMERRVNESLFVGDAEIKVLSTRNGKVRLGITAIRDLPVHRAEVRERIRAGEPLRRIEDRLDHRENQR